MILRKLICIFRIFIAIIISFHSSFCQTTFDEIDSDLTIFDNNYHNTGHLENRDALYKILSKSKKVNFLAGVSDTYRRLGILYKDIGDYDSAIIFTQYAYEISVSSNENYSLASNLNQFAVIYSKMNNTFKSLEYFIKSFNKYKEIGSYKGISDAGGNISEIYTTLDSLKLGLDYAKIALDARKNCTDTSNIGRNYFALAYTYEKYKNWDSSTKYYTIALQRAEKVNDVSSIIYSLNGFGRLNLTLKNINIALSYFNKALDTAIKYQNRPLLAETYGHLSNAYDQNGNDSIAFHFLKLKQVLDNTMLDSLTLKYIVYSENLNNTKEISRINTELKADKERQTLWMAILISIIISIVIISALIIWINYNKRRLAQKEAELQSQKVNDLLQKQEVENVNAMLKGQDAERKRIAQELHDRLGSILSTVKLHFSAVEEQMNALKQQQHQSYGEATLLLDEAVDEVRRISHDLYEGSLAKFGFKTALLQLIAAIEKANTVKILFIDNGVDEGIYKNHAQELYRITQELLSNTLKYSGATEITLQLSLKENTFDFMYEDNGKGFDKKYAENGSGIGYKNIAARVAKLNGNWHLDTHPGHGMTLLIEIPV